MDSEKITRARETALSIIETMEQDHTLIFSKRVALPQAVRILVKALDELTQELADMTEQRTAWFDLHQKAVAALLPPPLCEHCGMWVGHAPGCPEIAHLPPGVNIRSLGDGKPIPGMTQDEALAKLDEMLWSTDEKTPLTWNVAQHPIKLNLQGLTTDLPQTYNTWHHVFTCGTCRRVCESDVMPAWTGQYTCPDCAAKTS